MFEIGAGLPARCIRLHDRQVIPRSGARRLRYSVRYVPGVGAEITISISHTRLTSAARVIFTRYIIYIVRRFTTGSPSDETPWLPNKEMTKPCEVSDETSTISDSLLGVAAARLT
jgi:hypothetical protein